MENTGQTTLVVKIAKIAPMGIRHRVLEPTHSVMVEEPSTSSTVSFSAVYQPQNLLERPKVGTRGPYAKH